MKAAMNGVPTTAVFSTAGGQGLCEHGVNGWAIGEADDERDDESALEF